MFCGFPIQDTVRREKNIKDRLRIPLDIRADIRVQIPLHTLQIGICRRFLFHPFRLLQYDSVILGSSMTVNFNTNWFREEMGLHTIKLNYSGAYPKDQSNIMEVIFESGHTVEKPHIFIRKQSVRYILVFCHCGLQVVFADYIIPIQDTVRREKNINDLYGRRGGNKISDPGISL